MSTQRIMPEAFSFYVLPQFTAPGLAPGGYLIFDRWNDYGYVTMFDLKLRTIDGAVVDIGQVKFGQFNIDASQARPAMPEVFTNLNREFFSLGQDVSYYEALRDNLDEDARITILQNLRDMAYNRELYEQARGLQISVTSLFRSVNPLTVEVQFHRIAHGGVSATAFDFEFVLQAMRRDSLPLSLQFKVEPESYPPTNVHALIGSNGVGKTRVLRHLADAVADSSQAGRVHSHLKEPRTFANLVSVSFNAFDSLKFVPPNHLQHTFISLDWSSYGGVQSFSHAQRVLTDQFAYTLDRLTAGPHKRWARVLETLSTDPILNDLDLRAKFQPRTLHVTRELGQEQTAAGFFESLSSGHKIVLLAMVRLVEKVSERTLVLIDEPETHLHPPLLSTFIRAISELLIDQNGVAIVATHSPVVLQETPRDCVWKLRRSGDAVTAERPKIETFGENVGVLTREVFGLEVTRSGFHKMLENVVRSGYTFDQAVAHFSGQLGGEAFGLLRVLIAERDQRDGGPF